MWVFFRRVISLSTSTENTSLSFSVLEKRKKELLMLQRIQKDQTLPEDTAVLEELFLTGTNLAQTGDPFHK